MEKFPINTDFFWENYQDIINDWDISDNSKKDYCYSLTPFLSFLGQTGLTLSSFKEYKEHLRNSANFASPTKDHYLVVASRFLKFIFQQEVIPKDVTVGIKGFKKTHYHKRLPVLKKEFQLIIDYILGEYPSPEVYRLKAILYLLGFQGFREIEVCRLTREDVNIPNKIIHVQGKHRDDKQIVNLHPSTANALETYIDSNNIKSGPLFISNSFNSIGKPITTRGLRKIVTELFIQLGIKKKPHALRAFFTIQLLKKFKGDLILVSEFTRHRSLNQVKVYAGEVEMEKNLPNYYEAFN